MGDGTRPRTPRTAIADELTALGFADGYDIAGHLLDALTDDDVVELAACRMMSCYRDEYQGHSDGAAQREVDA
jgi:hypothetical protein